MSDKNVPEYIRLAVYNRAVECIVKANQYYKKEFLYPEIRYDLKGACGGKALLEEWAIRVNVQLLKDNFEDYIENTVSHEVAHLIDYELHPENFYPPEGKSRKIHGKTFKFIMKHVFKADPSTTHNYDVSKVKRKRKKTEKYVYKCPDCGDLMEIGKNRHNKMQRKQASYFLISCKKKGHDIKNFEYVGKVND